jgi:MFS family permease
MPGTAASARRALASRDFRRLFAIRLVSQSADGLFQAALVASVVFSPEDQSTASGFAVAVLLISLPFSVVGPFTGVFIDRWPRRAILVVTPLLRVAVAWLVLFEPSSAPVLFYAGAVWVLSVNRFYLATAVAVVPRLVPTEDLLMANSLTAGPWRCCSARTSVANSSTRSATVSWWRSPRARGSQRRRSRDGSRHR